MNAMDKGSPKAAEAVDTDQFRLRRFIERLANTDELETRADAVPLSDIAAVLEGNARAVHFRKAGPEGQEMVGGVCASRSRLAYAFGVEIDQLAAEVQRRTRLTPKLIEVPRALDALRRASRLDRDPVDGRWILRKG